MNNNYLISCSSPVDVDFDYFNKRGAEVLFFTYLMDEKEHEDADSCGNRHPDRYGVHRLHLPVRQHAQRFAAHPADRPVCAGELHHPKHVQDEWIRLDTAHHR